MGRRWFAPALFFVLISAACYAEGASQSAPGAAEDITAVPAAKEPFQADRIAEAYDRAAKKTDLKNTGAAAPITAATTSFASLISKLVLSLLVIIGAIYGLSYLGRNWVGKTLLSTTGPLKVLARQPLSQKHTLYVVSALGRFLIIGEGPQGLACLSQFDDSEENREISETWGWSQPGIQGKGRFLKAAASPFGPSLQSHVEDLERELSRLREAS
jgi:flagellar biogenesis protein FliO